MPEYRKFASDVGIVGIANVFVSLRGIILIPILTKTLGGDQYGIYALLISTVNLLLPLVTCYLDLAMGRFLAGEKEKKEIQEGVFSVFSIIFCNGLLISILVSFLSGFLASNFFGGSSAAPVIQIGAFLILLWALDAASLNFFRTIREMKTFSSLLILETLLEAGIASSLVLTGFKLIYVITSFLIVRAVIISISLSLIIKRIGILIPKFYRIREFLTFSLPLIPFSFLQWISDQSDRYIMGFFLTPTDVGAYAAAFAICGVITAMATPITINLTPTATKLWEDEKMGELKTHLRYCLKYFLMISLPTAFGLTSMSQAIIGSLTTHRFVSLANDIIPILAAGTIIRQITYLYPFHVLYLAKKTKIITCSAIISAGIGFVLNLVLIPIIGIYGTAISFLSSGIALLLSCLFASSKIIPFEIDKIFMVKSLLSSLVMSFFILSFNPQGWQNILIFCLLGAIVYFSSLWLMRGFENREKEFFRGIITRLWQRLYQ